MDLLGDQCGQDLFFHGEPCSSVEDVAALVTLAKFIVLPVRSIKHAWEAYRNSEIASPTLLVAPEKSLYYQNGQRSTAILETTVMQCLMSLPEPPKGAAN
jgi:hypothetical protein